MSSQTVARAARTVARAAREVQVLVEMEIEITLDMATVHQLLCEITPVRIQLDPSMEQDTWLELESPRSVELVEGRGLRVSTSGRLRLQLAGFEVPISLETVVFVLEPKAQFDGKHALLVFGIDVEDGDLVHVPALIDTGIRAIVNRQLAHEKTRITWPFGISLSGAWALPSRVEPALDVRLDVARGNVRVTGEAIHFKVWFDAHFDRERPRP